jgi:hypothetical protein
MDGLNSEKYPESFLEKGLEPSGMDDLWGPFRPTKKTPPPRAWEHPESGAKGGVTPGKYR